MTAPKPLHNPFISQDQAALPGGYDIAQHKVKDECGVFGVYAPGKDVARMTYFGIFSLQHRGQESAGIAVSTGKDIVSHKNMGLVTQVFKDDTLKLMRGDLAVGHVRYSTTGSSIPANAQPLILKSPHGPVALTHNGNLINHQMLRRELEQAGTQFVTTTDSEVIAQLLALSHAAGDVEEAITHTMRRLQGAYTLVLMTPDKLIGLRDPYGIRPLCLGVLGPGEFVLASESCALNIVGARFLREVNPGEMVVIGKDGLKSYQALVPTRSAMCLFEFIYFARPDSHLMDKSLLDVRHRMGERLAREYPADADIVIPVPDSGTPAAIGYSKASGIPFAVGLIKNHYVQRTFIQPTQLQRELGIKMKLNPVQEVIRGKRVVLVDDSIVRGTTSRKIVTLLKEAGATEIHLRVSSPPVTFPCHYGIDMATRAELMASSFTVDETCRQLGCDSLGYLSLPGLLGAVGQNPDGSTMCHACFTGNYPMSHAEQLGLMMEPVF